MSIREIRPHHLSPHPSALPSPPRLRPEWNAIRHPHERFSLLIPQVMSRSITYSPNLQEACSLLGPLPSYQAPPHCHGSTSILGHPAILLDPPVASISPFLSRTRLTTVKYPSTRSVRRCQWTLLAIVNPI